MRLLAATIALVLLFPGCSESPLPAGPSLTAFTASWCGPCQKDKPLLAEIAAEFTVTEIDINSESDVAARYRVTSVPTYLVVHGCVEVRRTSNLRLALSILRQLKP